MPQPSQLILDITRLGRRCITDIIGPYSGTLKPTEVTDNGNKDMVTIADKLAEAYLFGGLNTLAPDHALLGEETWKRQPRTLRNMTARRSFVVDSLDGTADFVAQSLEKQNHGLQAGSYGWGVLIAERAGPATIRGWIFKAVPTATGWDSSVIVAERDKGIWISGSSAEPFGQLSPRNEGTLRRDETGRPIAIMHDDLLVPGVLQPDALDRIKAGDTEFAWQKSMWSAVAIHEALILGQIAGYVHGPVYPWDKAAGIDLMLGMVGGKAMALNDAAPFRLERMGGGVAAGSTPAFCDAARADVCLPVEATQGIEPCIAAYPMGNPYDAKRSLGPSSRQTASLRTSSP